MLTNQRRKFWTRKFWQITCNSPNLPKFSPSKILYHTVVGYFYDVAPGRIYKNQQGKLAQLLIYSPVQKPVKPHLLIGYLRYYTSASALPQPRVITKISYS